HQDGIAACRERARAPSDHAARLVHLLGKCRRVHYDAAHRAGRRLAQHAEALAALDRQQDRVLRQRSFGHYSLPCTNATRLPTVANVAPSISSSSMTKPKRSSSDASTLATAIESSSGTLPSSGVVSRKPCVRPLR